MAILTCSGNYPITTHEQIAYIRETPAVHGHHHRDDCPLCKRDKIIDGLNAVLELERAKILDLETRIAKAKIITSEVQEMVGVDR